MTTKTTFQNFKAWCFMNNKKPSNPESLKEYLKIKRV